MWMIEITVGKEPTQPPMCPKQALMLPGLHCGALLPAKTLVSLKGVCS